MACCPGIRVCPRSEIPPTVQGVIASRIDRLPNEDKALLQLASVVGPRVSPQLLTAVTTMPAAQLQSRLWSLEILDFLVESRWLAAPEYEFAHDLKFRLPCKASLRRASIVCRMRTKPFSSSPLSSDRAFHRNY